ncbi:MAG TPA: M56 family metallopeptidase [Candidatus Eremiobacteraceae bacterium]|nr:M56 family metallopeptidase [Candidatus Eremiobacteraceae bacterium]
MIVQAVGALFNACWQGLALFVAISLGLRLFSRSSAATRYAIWFAALLVVAALPAIDFGLANVVRSQPSAEAAPSTYAIVRTGTVTYHSARAQSPSRPAVATVPTTTIGFAVEVPPDRLTQLRAFAAGAADRMVSALRTVAVPIVLAWLCFGGLMLTRLVLAYARLRRVKLGLVPLENASVDRLIARSNRPIVVGVVSDLAMPCVLGFARPAIALPARLAAELTPEDLERIVRHEHAHVRRWDDVANALQLILQAVVCLNPAMHLIGRSLNVEREIACDDFAVEPLAERVQYAKCLTHIALNGLGRRRAALPAPGFFFNRKQLLVRVERLLERGHNGSTTLGATARYALAGLALVALAVARVQLPVFAAPAHTDHANQTASNSTLPFGGRLASHAIRHFDRTRLMPARAAIRHIEGAHASAAHALAARIASTATTVRAAHAHQLMHKIQTPTRISMRSDFKYMFNTDLASGTAPVAPVAAPAPSPHPAPLAPMAPSPIRVASSGVDFLDALAAAGYKNLTVDQLVRMKNVGVDGALIDAAVRYSGSKPTVEMLVHMAAVGVDADYLRHLQDSGYPRMGLEDVVRVRALGIDPSYIRDMTAVLHVRPSMDQLTQLRALGVDPDYVRSFAQLGYDKLSPDDLVRLRATGVDADYVRMLRSKGIGGSGLSVEDLVRMKSAGVE